MYLLFPDTQTLTIAISSGQVPASIAAAPVEYAAHEDGRVWIQPSVEVAKSVRDALKPLGVVTRKSTRGAGSPSQTVESWPQILPLEKSPAGPFPQNGLSDRAPVLFELPEAADLREFVSEMLRLGNDRQSYRQQKTSKGVKTLLLVKGPPYYTLLRAIDALDGDDSPRAFIEQAPGVWVQLGYRHPLAEQIQPPEGTILLLAPPREWSAIDEGKFQDIYEALKFEVPGDPVSWEAGGLETPLKVPLRLVRGGSDDPAEFWVLSQAGVKQLEDLVQNADDRLIARLAFAVGTSPNGEGERTVVVRLRPAKETPPVLVLDGVACRSYLRLPNLFLPLGQRLHPPLRRDAVKDLLASDDEINTWLLPDGDGRFWLQSLSEDAFRPLSDWVDYVLESERDELAGWSAAMEFEFESFVCAEEDELAPSQLHPKNRPESQPDPRKEPAPSQRTKEPAPAKSPKPKTEAKSAKPKTTTDRPDTIAAPPPSELQLKLETLEKQFRERPEPWDSPDRRDLWWALAETNQALGEKSEAAICYLNGIWNDEVPAADWVSAWYHAEIEDRSIPPMTGEEFEATVSAKRPTPMQMNWLAVHLLAAAFGERMVPEHAPQNLDAAQKQLKPYENYLPLRLTWLAWLACARLSGGDFLTLARSRDRLLERLYDFGPSPEMDLPGFLRSAGPKTGERVRAVKDAMRELRGRVQTWITREIEDQKTAGLGQTAAYADLMIAYGYARVGLKTECEELLEQTAAHLQKPAVSDPVHDWFLRAFRHRIDQALKDEPRSGTLPEELLKPLTEKTLDSGSIFVIDSLRSKSRILEPYEGIGSHTRQIAARAKGPFDLDAKLEHLTDIENRDERAEAARELLDKHGGETILESFNLEINNQALLTGLLQLAPRLGDSAAFEFLRQVPETLPRLNNPGQQAALLDRAIFVAAHFGHPAQVRQFIGQLHELMETAGGPETTEAFGLLLGQSFRGLRKLGMRGEVAGLLDQIEKLDEANRFETPPPDSAKSKKRRSVKRAQSRDDQQLSQTMEAMTLRLHLAAGWFHFGNDERARQILDGVSQFLFGERDLKPHLRRRFARRYAAALELAPLETAIPKLLEIFDRLTKITKGQGAGLQDEYYAYELLEVIDSVVLALASEEMTRDPKARQILEEMEFSIRRRIHRDMESAEQTSDGSHASRGW